MKGKRKKEEQEKIIRAEDEWEPIGHTPMPHVTDLRNWDRRLLETYKPFYAPFCDLCCLCTYGKCDLTGTNRGACGIDISAQQGRIVTLACCMGMSAHAGHAAHIIDYLIEKHGEDYPIDLGDPQYPNCLRPEAKELEGFENGRAVRRRATCPHRILHPYGSGGGCGGL